MRWEKSIKKSVTKADIRDRTIIKTLEENPQGLGLNELHKKTKDDMAKETLRKQLEGLMKKEFVVREPQDPRQGQKHTYNLTGEYETYNSHLNNLMEYGGLLYYDLIKFEYILVKNLTQGKEREKLVEDFNVNFAYKILTIYLISLVSSHPYPDVIKTNFLNIANKIVEKRVQEFASIVRKNVPSHAKNLFAFPVPKILSKIEGKDQQFLEWVKTEKNLGPKDFEEFKKNLYKKVSLKIEGQFL